MFLCVVYCYHIMQNIKRYLIYFFIIYSLEFAFAKDKSIRSLVKEIGLKVECVSLAWIPLKKQLLFPDQLLRKSELLIRWKNVINSYYINDDY